MSKLVKEQEEFLKRLAKEIMNLATEVVEDYKNNPSEISGSITEVHIDSPMLDDDYYPYNTEFSDGKTPEEMNRIDEENKRDR